PARILSITASPAAGASSSAARQKASTVHPAPEIWRATVQRSFRDTEGRDEYGCGAWPVGMGVLQQTAQWETAAAVRQAEH
ncbi:MAG: hypothetical protein Q9197_002376, partial [Variospora fuerteventurae]